MLSAFHFVDSEGSGGDVIVGASEYPILWAFAALDKKQMPRTRTTLNG